MKLPVLGIGAVSAAGCGVEALKAVLEGTRSPQVESISVPGKGGPFDLPVYVAAADGLERFMPRRALRRLDKLTRMALLASFLAVEDSGLNITDRSRLGLVFGTGYGPLGTTFRYQDTIIDDGDKGASPTLFANSVHNAPASAVSIFMKIQGPCLTLTNFETTTAEVLRTAQVWLEQGTVDYVLAAVGDEYEAVLGHVLHREGAGRRGRIDPLQFDQCSYLPAEGFVAFLFGREGPDGKYGAIRRIASEHSALGFSKESIGRHRAVFLSANGDRRSGPLYRPLARAGLKVAAYSPLYGALPVGLGFDLALAGISCRAQQLYPSPASGTDTGLDLLTEGMPLRDGEWIGCLQCSPRCAALISIAKS